MAKTKVNKTELETIRKALLISSDDLNDAKLKPAGPTDFGGSGLGKALGHDAHLASHHVLETSRKMGGGVAGFADALKRAEKAVDDTDDQAQNEVGEINSSVSTIGIQYADPSNRPRPRHHDDQGRTR